MMGQTHVVDIDRRILRVGKRDGMGTEAEIVDTVGTFSDSEKGLAVTSFDAHHKDILTVPFYSS